MQVAKVLKEHWRTLSENAHAVAFNEFKPQELDRIDFALVVEDESTFEPLAYAVCREHDAKTLYLQFGGAFHGALGTSLSFASFLAGIEYCKSSYKRLVMRVANDNQVMLKFASKAGFLIVGVNNYSGVILLEHQLEFEK